MKKFKAFVNIVISVLGIGSLGVIVSFPFLHEYINPILSNCLFWFSIIIFTIITIKRVTFIKDTDDELTRDAKDKFKLIFMKIILIFFISSYIILNYKVLNMYNALFLLILYLINNIEKIYYCIAKIFFKEDKSITINKYAKCFYLALDGIFLCWSFDRIIWQLVFGVIALACLFINLVKSFLSFNFKEPIMLAFDFILGIILTAYLLYIIPLKPLLDILIPLISAIYGGLITLTGVAWTIRYTNKQYKQENILKAKPYLSVRFKIDSNIIYDYIFLGENKGLYNRNTIYIKNTDNGIYIIDYIEYKDKKYKAVYGNIVDKNATISLNINSKEVIDIEKSILVGHDVLENTYKYKFFKNNEGRINMLEYD